MRISLFSDVHAFPVLSRSYGDSPLFTYTNVGLDFGHRRENFRARISTRSLSQVVDKILLLVQSIATKLGHAGFRLNMSRNRHIVRE